MQPEVTCPAAVTRAEVDTCLAIRCQQVTPALAPVDTQKVTNCPEAEVTPEVKAVEAEKEIKFPTTWLRITCIIELCQAMHVSQILVYLRQFLLCGDPPPTMPEPEVLIPSESEVIAETAFTITSTDQNPPISMLLLLLITMKLLQSIKNIVCQDMNQVKVD